MTLGPETAHLDTQDGRPRIGSAVLTGERVMTVTESTVEEVPAEEEGDGAENGGEAEKA